MPFVDMFVLERNVGVQALPQQRYEPQSPDGISYLRLTPLWQGWSEAGKSFHQRNKQTRILQLGSKVAKGGFYKYL